MVGDLTFNAGMAAGTGVPAPGGAPPAPRLPKLRPDLKTMPGGCDRDGAPLYLLHDPASNRFFTLGWMEAELLARWDHGDAEAVRAATARDTPLFPTCEDVAALGEFLVQNSLNQATSEAERDRLLKRRAAGRKHWAMWLLKNYLFIRIPLLHPDALLARLAGPLGFLYGRAFAWLTGVALLFGLFLALRQWEDFLGSLLDMFTLQGLLLMAVALSVSKILHELGHALTAHRHGCHVASMGVAFLVLWPILYTDTTDAWRLTDRRKRLAIAAAGMQAELMLAAWATLAWSFLPDGPLRGACFVLASTTWIMTLLVNLNPLMKFDGYFLASDLLGEINLQERAFAMARWQMREALFGFGDAPPERLPAGRRTILTAFAFAVWIYRFFLFLGIALMVYHLAFKLLGIFLMAVELVWFIGRPVFNETANWWSRRASLKPTRQLIRTVLLVGGGIALLVVPWQSSLSVPAVLKPEQQITLFSPRAAMIVEVAATPDRLAEPGDVLVRLQAPDLDLSLKTSELEVKTLEWQAGVFGVDPDWLERRELSAHKLETERARLDGLRQDHARLSVSSPFAGYVTDMDRSLRAGVWVGDATPLMRIVNFGRGRLDGLIVEEDLGAVDTGALGRFIPDDPLRPGFKVMLSEMSAGAVKALPDPALASRHGGPVSAEPDRDNRLIPEETYYAATFHPMESVADPGAVVRGTVLVKARGRSIIGAIWRQATMVVLRESGF